MLEDWVRPSLAFKVSTQRTIPKGSGQGQSRQESPVPPLLLCSALLSELMYLMVSFQFMDPRSGNMAVLVLAQGQGSSLALITNVC